MDPGAIANAAAEGPAFVTNLVDNNCCECWKDGCGLDPVFGAVADVLECINPVLGTIASAIWCFGSPLAFPCIFLFDKGEDHEDSWKITMLQAPCVRPLTCCLTTLVPPIGQFYVRRKALRGDMTKYKLWQGHHDGPHCFARHCPGAPITIEAGTYGEQDCPNAFLCLEVWVLGGCFFSSCCAFDVTRQMMRDDLELPMDPTEVRQHKCQAFFGTCMHNACRISMCMHVTACLCSCCAVDSGGAQEFAGQAHRTGAACGNMARTCFRGIWATKLIAIGCMSAQMIHEMEEGKGLLDGKVESEIDLSEIQKQQQRGGVMKTRGAAPLSETMDRGATPS